MGITEGLLSRVVKRGRLTIRYADGRERTFGSPDPEFEDVVVRFADRGVSGAIARDLRLGAAEAFMDGRLLIEQGDILSLLTLMRGNAPWSRSKDLRIPNPLRRAISQTSAKLSRLNWESRSRRNVAHHYDLGNDFYRLFLDEDLQYSCAYFSEAGNSLEQAQLDKKAHIAAKLALQPGQRVLDIGCGWGGMALYLNRVADVDVLGITLSEEQLKVARERAEAAGVADRVKFELVDYRKLTGQFDRIVSVGMFEHVGPPHYREFFRICHNLLTEDGVMLLHTIGRFGGPGTTDAFVRKYIFPGGYIPALSEIVSASEKNKLIIGDIETLRLHYGLTGRHWYQRSVENRDKIIAMYDERFYRMWLFYLAGVIVTFQHGGMGNYQIQYLRNRHTVPITRDYLGQAEERYRSLQK